MKTGIPCLLLGLALFSSSLFSQQVAPVKMKHVRKADRLFLDYKYKKALPLYVKALEKYPNNSTVNLRIGLCYFFLPSAKFKSLKYLEKAEELVGKDTVPDLYYYLAMANHRENKFENAIHYYDIFRTFLKDENETKNIERQIEMCRSGIELTKDPLDIQLINLSNSVNSSYPDYSPVLSPDNNTLIFTSKREGSTGKRMTEDDFYYYEDVYFSKRIGKDKWKASEKLDTAITHRRWLFGGVEYEQAKNAQTINTKDHDASISISPDGKNLFVYRRGDIWVSEKKEEGWGRPKPVDLGVNTLAQEPSLVLSFDQKTIFLISERAGGIGGKDIYVKHLISDTTWTPLENLGPVVNTPYDEESPYLMPDGKTLYFSSQGHNSIGGFDVFKTVLEGEQWSSPQNIGFPVNSGTDDIFFILNADTSLGHFSTERKNGLGDHDIYAVSFIPTWVGVQFVVYDVAAKQLLKTQIRIQGEYNQDTTITTSNSSLQISKAKLYNGKQYTFSMEREGFRNKTLPLNLPGIRGKEKMLVFAELFPITGKKNDTIGTRAVFYELLKNIPPESIKPLCDTTLVNRKEKLSALASGKDSSLFRMYTFEVLYKDTTTPIVVTIGTTPMKTASDSLSFGPVYFGFAKTGLNDEAKTVLDTLSAFMKENISVKVTIEGYTDSKGSLVYNKSLSRKRAEIVAHYLAKKGISRKRVELIGAGEENPVAPNENPDGSDNLEGRKKNRRVELKIINNKD